MPPSIDDAIRPAEAVAEPRGSAAFVIGRVGVVGLGHMGHAFAVNLVEDGREVVVHDRDPERMAALLAMVCFTTEPGPNRLRVNTLIR
jgi:UDP-N-acetyl-D-mannosaminuronate dehydrogenase